MGIVGGVEYQHVAAGAGPHTPADHLQVQGQGFGRAQQDDAFGFREVGAFGVDSHVDQTAEASFAEALRGFVPFGFGGLLGHDRGGYAGVGEGLVQPVGVGYRYGVENGLEFASGAVLPPVDGRLGQDPVVVGGGDAGGCVVAAGADGAAPDAGFGLAGHDQGVGQVAGGDEFRNLRAEDQSVKQVVEAFPAGQPPRCGGKSDDAARKPDDEVTPDGGGRVMGFVDGQVPVMVQLVEDVAAFQDAGAGDDGGVCRQGLVGAPVGGVSGESVDAGLLETLGRLSYELAPVSEPDEAGVGVLAEQFQYQADGGFGFAGAGGHLQQ